MKRNVLMIMLLAVLASSSCSKKDDASSSTTPTTNPQVKIDFLTTGKWKLKGLSINPSVNRGGQMVTDLMIDISSWTLDNTRIFAANGSGFEDEGPTKLSTTDPQLVPMAWSFNSDQTKFTLSIFDPKKTYTNTYDMLQLDASTMKYTYPQDWTTVSGSKPGTTYVYTVTYGH